MARFEGNLESFIRFIGPVSRNIVSDLTRKHKKHTTCQHPDCKMRKPLEAAHVTGRERPTIIAEILENYTDGKDNFSVDLNEFKTRFIEAHLPIENVIKLLCKEHHLEYDRKNNITPEYPVIIDEFEDENGAEQYSTEDLNRLEDDEIAEINRKLKASPATNLKDEISNKFSVDKRQVCFARISIANGLWNFDIKKAKFEKDIYLIFYNPNNQIRQVAKIAANTLKLSLFAKKGSDTIRLFIDTDFKDRNEFDFSGLILK